MQTRKEREQELLKQEIKEKNQLENIENALNSFLSRLENFNPNHTHEYNLADEVAINELKTAINTLEIPEEIKVKQENEITFSNITKKVLVYFFVLSLAVMSFSLYVGIRGLSDFIDQEKIDQEKVEEYHNLKLYFLEMKKTYPKSHKRVLKKLRSNKIP